MPNCTCAVADCTTYSQRKDSVLFPRRKDPALEDLGRQGVKVGIVVHVIFHVEIGKKVDITLIFLTVAHMKGTEMFRGPSLYPQLFDSNSFIW